MEEEGKSLSEIIAAYRKSAIKALDEAKKIELDKINKGYRYIRESNNTYKLKLN